MRRDLKPAADLIELCFAESLTVDGHRYLQSMRATADRFRANSIAAPMTARNSMPLAGYIWEEGSELVGNLSLIPFFQRGRRVNMIANVAVHPNHRRRGIARALTKAALEKTRRRRVPEVWLQARHDNPAAVSLYSSMGFIPQAKRTTWTVRAKTLQGEMPLGSRVTLRTGRHWDQQRSWLMQNYPTNLRWHIPIKEQAMKPGLLGLLYRIFAELRIRHWGAQHKDQLLGVLTWQATRTHADHIWLAAPPETEEMALQTILPFIRQEYRLQRPLSLEYPAGRGQDILLAAGFEPQHTLIWMKVKP
jgi:GNAT superfamily N-acetyltransferase